MTKKWWQFWKAEQKSNALGVLIRQSSTFTSYNFASFVQEAYQQNTTVYACIQEYVKAWASCPIIIKRGEDVIQNDSITKLLNNPNFYQSQDDFFENVVIYYLVGGEAPVYGDAVIPTRLPKELQVLRPDWLVPTLSTTQVGAVAEWRYTASDIQAQSMSISPANLMMFKAFNPLCRYRGLSPLNPAAFAIDQLNEYNRTNYSLLKNGMQPSGSLTTESTVDDDKFERLREQFADTYTGSGNNGKPIILEGGLKWQPFGFNLRDAEFLGGKTSSKKDICEVLGVPTQLIGIEGSQTYANYEQARAAFYEDRAIPLLNMFLSGLNRWLGLRAGLRPDDVICVDNDGVLALEPRRADRNKMLDTLQSITVNEKRTAMGYEPKDGGDELLVNSGLVPIEMAGADIPPMGGGL